jgi:parallel beta-helix repeat protein
MSDNLKNIIVVAIIGLTSVIGAYVGFDTNADQLVGANSTITALTALTTVADEDVMVIVDDPSGTPTTKKITRANFLSSAPATISTLTITRASGSYAEFTQYASASAVFGAGLSDCDTGATSKLLWDVTTGRFSCGTDQAGSGSSTGFSGIEIINSDGTFGTHYGSVSFDASQFTVTFPTASSAYVRLDWTNGPASRSADQTITGFWNFSRASASYFESAKINGAIVVDGDTYSRDSTGIQSAINALPSTGGEVLIPAGSYSVTATISVPSNVTIRGQGSATKLTNANSATWAVISNSDRVNGNKNIKLIDLYLDGNEGNAAGAFSTVNFLNVSSSSLDSLYVTGARRTGTYPTVSSNGEGIRIRGGGGNRISGGVVFKNNYDGIKIWDSDYNTVVGVTMIDNGRAGIQMSSGADNNSVLGNTVYHSTGTAHASSPVTAGLYQHTGDYNTYANNTVYGTTQGWGCTTGADYNVVTGNTFRTRFLSGYAVIDVEDTCDYNLFSNNVVAPLSGASGEYVHNQSDSDNNQFMGNKFTRSGGTGTWSIVNDSGNDNNVFFGNVQDNESYTNSGSNNGILSIDADNGFIGIGKINPTTTLDITGNASVSTNFEVLGFASASQNFGAGLSTCNGANQALTWSAGLFGCATISASGGGIAGIEVDAVPGGTQLINRPSISFDNSAFNVTASGSTDVRISLDYSNGPASRSASNTWTALNVFSLGASVSTNLEVSQTASISSLKLNLATGLLKSTSGTVGLAVADTDYQSVIPSIHGTRLLETSLRLPQTRQSPTSLFQIPLLPHLSVR